MRAAIGAMLMVSAGGAHATPADAEIQVHGAGKCDAAGAKRQIGRKATKAVGAEALRLSGARTLRWIRPGSAVTMDYREDRLNIHLDRRNRIVRITCG